MRERENWGGSTGLGLVSFLSACQQLAAGSAQGVGEVWDEDFIVAVVLWRMLRNSRYF